MDKDMVVGHLRDGGTTDPIVIRSRYMALKSKLELYRTLALIPLVVGGLQIAAGIIGLLILVGIFLIMVGAFFLGAGLWLRSRLTRNLTAATEAYQECAAQLAMPAA
jgi:hypothetical protein